MSHLNELGTVLEMEKHYFDSQSKIILSFKDVQACLLQQCLKECRHLSLDSVKLFLFQDHYLESGRSSYAWGQNHL